jgi:hypothetical protein
MINWDWIIKLKTNKNYIKGLRTKKNRNQENKDWSWDSKNKKNQIVIFRKKKKKLKKKQSTKSFTGDKPPSISYTRRTNMKTSHQQEENAKVIQTLSLRASPTR